MKRVIEKIRAVVAELTDGEDDSKFAKGEIAKINKKGS